MRRGVLSCRGISVAMQVGVLAAIAFPAVTAKAADVGLDMGADMSAEDLLAKAPKLEETSGWYLRGDVGYVFNELPDWAEVPIFPVILSPELDDAWMFGIGAGVRLNDVWRIDVTADYRTKADYAALGLSADYSTTTILANVYADLGTWSNLTPYVGAGIGGGYISASGIEALGVSVGDIDGWGFAWALMGGVAVDLAPNWQLDLGYRYVNLDDVTNTLNFHQSAHELRVGVRYLLD